LPAGEELRALGGRGELLRRGLELFFAELGAAADRFDRDGFDHELLGAVDEAEARLVCLLEGRLHLRE